MVKLTMDLIGRGTSGYARKKKDETLQQFLRRLTHLYLENKNITEVGEDLSLCRNVIVLYLYDNQLTEIPCLNHNCNLTHLYLQNNNITKIENLSALSKLVKLYLGGNQITVIEGVEKLQQLQELHVEHQHLPPGEQLLFDPRSLNALSQNLEILNISGNSLESMRELEVLHNLTQLFASDNLLNDMKEISHLLASWPKLWRLELVGNPLCHKAKYKDRVIVMCSHLGMLDGKEITDTARQFLQKWHANRETTKKKRDEFIRQASFSETSLEHPDLPPVLTQPRLQSSVPGFLMPGLPRKEFDDVLHRSASATASKTQYTTLRSKIFDNNHGYYRSTRSSAPLRRQPLISVSVELMKKYNSPNSIAPF